MSALPLIADIDRGGWHVRFVPILLQKSAAPPSAQLSNPMGTPLESILRGASIFWINVARRDAKNLFATISAKSRHSAWGRALYARCGSRAAGRRAIQKQCWSRR